MKVYLSRTSLLVALTILPCAPVVWSQESQRRLDTAAMFDEYGRIGGCDHSARLDNLAIQLQNDSNLEAYLVYYGPESASEATLGYIQSYLVNSRGLAEERFRTIYAGPNSDPSKPRIQFWVAPRGSLLPELPQYENKVENFQGLFDERERWDGISFGVGELTGPPVPDVTVPSLIDMLKKRTDIVVYLVAFNGEEGAPGAWRRVAQLETEHFADNGIEGSRIKPIYGGTAKETKIQFWILPKTAALPVKDAGPEPLPEKTIQIGNYSDYDLTEERGERWAFNGFLEVLRSSEKLRACIIVRLESDEPVKEWEDGSEEEPVVEASIRDDVSAEAAESVEVPSVDLLRLVEKWKVELADKHKLQEDRIIVLFASAPKYSAFPILMLTRIPRRATKMKKKTV